MGGIHWISRIKILHEEVTDEKNQPKEKFKGVFGDADIDFLLNSQTLLSQLYEAANLSTDEEETRVINEEIAEKRKEIEEGKTHIKNSPKCEALRNYLVRTNFMQVLTIRQVLETIKTSCGAVNDDALYKMLFDNNSPDEFTKFEENEFKTFQHDLRSDPTLASKVRLPIQRIGELRPNHR